MFLEAHDLIKGQVFSFTEHGPRSVVDALGIIEAWDVSGGESFMYHNDEGLHTHHRDHTPVWVE